MLGAEGRQQTDSHGWQMSPRPPPLPSLSSTPTHSPQPRLHPELLLYLKATLGVAPPSVLFKTQSKHTGGGRQSCALFEFVFVICFALCVCQQTEASCSSRNLNTSSARSPPPHPPPPITPPPQLPVAGEAGENCGRKELQMCFWFGRFQKENQRA